MAAKKVDLDISYIKTLRRANQLQCHLEDCSGKFADSEERLKQHFSRTDEDILDSRKATLTQCVTDCRKFNGDSSPAEYSTWTRVENPAETWAAMFCSRAALKSNRGLYDPKNPFKETALVKTRQSNRERKQEPLSHATPTDEDLTDDEHITPLIKQPDTRPISQEQLVAEVKGIYAGLVMVESKCIELDNELAGAARDRLSDKTRNSRDSANPAFGSKGRRIEPRSFLPVLVEGNAARALPDTEAGYNVVTENFAASMGAALDRDPRKQRTFTNAVGGKFQSCGIAELNIALPKNAGKGSRSKFAVLKKCAVPLVLGNSFLRENEIFTTVGYSHNLVKAVSSSVAASSKKMFRVMHMEQPRQKLLCTLDSRYAFANADTGSDIDLVSLEYAEWRGWDIKRLHEHEESYVMLADEEEVQLAGYVEASLSIEGNEMIMRFYVLQGLVCSIILGDTTLESLDAFKNFKDAFVDWSQGDDSICMVTWAKRFDKVEEDVEDILRRLDHYEDLSEGRSDRPWLRSISSKRINETHRLDLEGKWRDKVLDALYSYGWSDPRIGMKYQIQSQLAMFDKIETECRTEFDEKKVSLEGNELRREQEQDERRRERHDQLRRRIWKGIDDVQRLIDDLSNKSVS
ncbi:hypothetical protein G7054_g284 [Neopestalotiopsis clavispora]|nr:hypothetical protein G7054_g284 [Neopestalotiopsis clavispora]